MIIYYNNKPIEVQDDISLLEAINSQEIIEHKAVWLNGDHVPLSEFDKIKLCDNDRIKVVRIRGGG